MKNIEISPSPEKLPKVSFEQLDIDREVELIDDYMKGDRWSSLFDKIYPELRVIQKESKNEEECLNRYKTFLKDLHARDEKLMVSAQEQIRSEWGKIGPDFLDALSRHFGTDWPGDKQDIVGYVSELPVFPRFLDEYSFCLGYKDISSMIEISAHEMLHFLWFKKWKEVFPETERKEFESPHLVWRLSEIMDPIILQSDPEIKKLINPRQWGYSSFAKIKIGDVSMTEYFKGIYLKSVSAGDDFETTLKKLYEEAKMHEKEISQF